MSALPAKGPHELSSMLTGYREQVMKAIRSALPDREPKNHLYGVIAELLASEGKCVRPAVCLATSRVFGGSDDRALPSASAIELLHNSFLVHDDIEDESLYRRGRPTLHQKIGVPLAINVGDAMNALSISVLRQNLPLLGPELSARIFDEFDHMTIETIEGQAMELGWIRDNNCQVSEDDYLLMVMKKTAWYSFIHPARIGALVAAPDRNDLDRFNKFGYFLGAAFQIQDDVLNLVGNATVYGKEIDGDLLEGKRTLILAHLFANSDASEKYKLKAFLGKPRAQRVPREVTWLKALLRARGSIDYARAAASQFVEGAFSELEVAYRDATPGPDLDFLRALISHVASRAH